MIEFAQVLYSIRRHDGAAGEASHAAMPEVREAGQARQGKARSQTQG